MANDLKIGVINISDRASAGIYEDIPGKAVVNLLEGWIETKWDRVYAVIPDDQEVIEQTLICFADEENCSLIITTGGTGPAPRDVTPKATESICQKMLPGFGELMRATSLEFVPTAILSRQTAGIRGKSLIVNLPGKPKAISECLTAVFPAIPYCIDLINGPYIEVLPETISIFRPTS
ncbi:MAG: molybdopterin adenylyltransferase [Rubritalea sp.]|jgi:molybdopterin adenylyltransferase